MTVVPDRPDRPDPTVPTAAGTPSGSAPEPASLPRSSSASSSSASGSGPGSAPSAGPGSAKPKRQLPKVQELRPLLQFKKPELRPTRRRLDAVLTIADLRRIAKRRTPKAAFDYADGAAEAETSLARARRTFADLTFHPAILRDVSSVDTGWDVLGRRSALPFGIAPTGFTRMMQTEGERAGAGAAAAAGIPFALSTMGTTSIEDVAAVAPGGGNWFML